MIASRSKIENFLISFFDPKSILGLKLKKLLNVISFNSKPIDALRFSRTHLANPDQKKVAGLAQTGDLSSLRFNEHRYCGLS